MEIVDHRLVGAMRVDLVDHAAVAGLVDGDSAFQTSTIEALLDGVYEGDLTVGELLAHGDLGVGTVDHLDGELIVIDGEAYVATVGGTIHPVAAEVGTPFAAVSPFPPGPTVPIGPCADLDALTDVIDGSVPEATVLAVRVDGDFDRLRVRSVARQEPPYRPLREVTAHQREHELTGVRGSLVGFRFPHVTDGLEVPGWHLHAIDDARTVGGHLIDVVLAAGTLSCHVTDELHVEVPAAVAARSAAVGHRDRRDEIAEVEGGRPDAEAD